MTSQTTTSRETLADSCRAVSEVLNATVGHLERSSRRATTIAAIGLLSLCAAVVLVAVRFYGWGVISQTIATVDSIALMAGGMWLDKIDKRNRADIAAVRRAVGHTRGEAVLLSGGFAESSANRPPRETMLSEAIATVDSIAHTAGGLWLEKVDRRSGAYPAVPRRSAERPPVDPVSPAAGPGVSGAHRAPGAPASPSGPSHRVTDGDGQTSGRSLTSNRESLTTIQDLFSNPHGIGRR